jgi:ATP-binding cassette subfamily B multidrug efflux pump
MSVAAKRLVTDKPQSPEQRALTVQHLTFRYGNTAEDILKDLNLRIEPGEKVMIRGKTGSGKTTLFKILTGLYGSKLFSSEGFVSFSPQKPLLLPATLA